MGYPFSWSTVQIYYNPKYVTTKPDSWHALLDPKYKGKISLENIPTDVMAIAGRATGAKKPYSMTTAEISRAKDFLKQLKPNVLKLASQNNEVVRALADGSAWIGITNLGTDDRVKDAGGPRRQDGVPEGGHDRLHRLASRSSRRRRTTTRSSSSRTRCSRRPGSRRTSSRTAGRSSTRRPTRSSSTRATATARGALFYNKPEKALKMTIKGPAGDEQAYVDAFNEVFGA